MSKAMLLERPSIRPSTVVPHTMELTVLLSEFMAYWAGAKTEFLDWGSVQPLAKPVEYIVRWNGSVKGTLLFRSSDRLLDKLMDRFQEKDKGFPNKTALFQEMVTLYSIFLINSTWVDDAFTLGPILARPCKPQDRPPMTESHVFCAMGVDREPVEIRLWIDQAGDPYFNWTQQDIEP
jgi:hypothetical protein